MPRPSTDTARVARPALTTPLRRRTALGQSVILDGGSAREGALGLRSGHGWNSSIDDRSGLFSEAGIPGREVDGFSQ